MINPFREIQWNPDLAKRREFALSLLVGFPILAVIFGGLGWVRHGAPAPWVYWMVGIGAGTGAVCWMVPQIAKPFYLAWYALACCIGLVVGNVLLSAVYYLVLTPIGLALRLAGRDPLLKRPKPGAQTYWEPGPKPVAASRYYRQF